MEDFSRKESGADVGAKWVGTGAWNSEAESET